MKFHTLLGLFTLSSVAVMATQVVDQNASTNNTFMAGFGQTGLAQSFQQTNDNISGAGIFLQQGIGSSDTVTISVWDALPNNAGTMLANGSAVGWAGNWVDVFWSAVSLTPGSTYFLVFTSLNNTLGISGDVNNGYSDGMVFANAGYGPFPSYDYTFRTYADDTFGSNPTTPSVPDSSATLPAFVAAFLGLVALKQRRRA